MRFAKVDKNQKDVVDALRKEGISVKSTAQIGKGFPDLVAANDKETFLIEVKGPKGTLTPDQVEFISSWRGTVHIIRTPDEALQLVGEV